MNKFLLCALVAVALPVSATMTLAADSTYISTAAGNFADSANWNNGVPGATGTTANGDTATFGSAITGNRTITVDANRNVKNITFDGALNNYALTGGSFLLTSGGAISAVNVTNKQQSIATPLTLEGDGGTYSFLNNSTGTSGVYITGAVNGVSTGANVTALTLGGTGTQTGVSGTGRRAEVSGAIGDGSGGGKLSINKTGTGLWFLTGANTYTGGTTLGGGTLNAGSAAALGTSGNITFTGGALQISAAAGATDYASRIKNSTGTIAIDNSVALGFAGNLDGTNTGGLTKTSAGVLTLSGTNAYTGTTTLAGGTTNVASAAALGATSGNISFTGGVLQVTSVVGATDYASRIKNSTSAIAIDNSVALSFAGGIDGTNTGGLTKTNTGVLTLGGVNAYTGTTTVTGGTLQLGGAGAIASGNALTTGAAGTFDVRGNAQTLGLVNNAGTVTNSTATTATLTIGNGSTGAGAYTGALNVIFNQGASSSTITGVFANTGNLTLNTTGAGTITLGTGMVNNTGTVANAGTGAGAVTIGGVIGANVQGVIQNSATSTLTLNGVNTYTGPTTIAAGTLVAGNANALGAGGNITFTGGTLQTTADFSSRIKNSTGAIGISNAAALTFANVLDGSNTGGLIKTGAGTLTLTAANTYSGGTTISAGALQIGNGGTSGSVLGNIVDNATLNFFRADATTFGGVISGTGGVTKLGGNTLALTGANTYAGATTLSNNGALQLDFSAAGAPAANIVNNTANSSGLSFSSGGALTVTGAAGAANAQQFNGLTIVTGGGTLTAMAGAGGTLGVSLGAITGGTYTGANTAATGLSAGSNAGFAINKNAAATVTSLTAADPLTGIYSGRFVMNNNDGQGWNFVTSTETTPGSGVFALAPYTNYADLPLSGTVTTNGGNTALAGSATTTGAITLNTLRIDTDGTAGEGLTLGGALTLTATAVGGSASSPGAILFVGADDYTISGGSLVRNGSIPRGVVIQQYGTGVLTINSVIPNNSSATTLVKAGPGEMVLGGANLYAGSTNIQEGTVTISSNANLGLEGAPAGVNLFGGATLRAANTFALEFATTPTGNMRGINLAGLNGKIDVTGTNVFTVNGVIAGATGSLNKTGPGTLTLGGANTYAIGTTVSAGTLLVTNTTGSGTGTGAVTVAAGATLGGTGTVSGATTVNGMLSVGAAAASPGLMTFNSASIQALTLTGTANAVFDIAGSGGVRGTDFDAVTITGGLVYGGTLTVNLGGFTPGNGSTYDLFDFGSESGTFSSIIFANGGYNGTLDYTTGVLTIMGVPEPSTWVWVAMATAVGGVYLNRRSRPGRRTP